MSVSTVCAGYDADYPTLSSRFSALAKVGDPLEERCNESHRRPEALDNARTLVREVRASADEMEVRHHRLQTIVCSHWVVTPVALCCRPRAG